MPYIDPSGRILPIPPSLVSPSPSPTLTSTSTSTFASTSAPVTLTRKPSNSRRPGLGKRLSGSLGVGRIALPRHERPDGWVRAEHKGAHDEEDEDEDDGKTPVQERKRLYSPSDPAAGFAGGGVGVGTSEEEGRVREWLAAGTARRASAQDGPSGSSSSSSTAAPVSGPAAAEALGLVLDATAKPSLHSRSTSSTTISTSYGGADGDDTDFEQGYDGERDEDDHDLRSTVDEGSWSQDEFQDASFPASSHPQTRQARPPTRSRTLQRGGNSTTARSTPSGSPVNERHPSIATTTTWDHHRDREAHHHPHIPPLHFRDTSDGSAHSASSTDSTDSIATASSASTILYRQPVSRSNANGGTVPSPISILPVPIPVSIPSTSASDSDSEARVPPINIKLNRHSLYPYAPSPNAHAPRLAPATPVTPASSIIVEKDDDSRSSTPIPPERQPSARTSSNANATPRSPLHRIDTFTSSASSTSNNNNNNNMASTPLTNGHARNGSGGDRPTPLRSKAYRERPSMRPFPTPGLKIMDRNPLEDVKSREEQRLDEDEAKKKHWKRWGPYTSERQWATVREDYSGNGDAWTHFPHEHARSRAYRWGEDGLAGISDNHQRLCFSVALWNGKDKILKERMFGCTGHQGNHGEDVKEMYYYLDSTPTHSYMKMLYKYPQREFPYAQLVEESQRRSRDVGEYEITDTDAFDDDRYWDVFVEYAKEDDDPDDLSIRITVFNRGPDPATLHIIPQTWFRNTWSWPKDRPSDDDMPCLTWTGSNSSVGDSGSIKVSHSTLGTYYLHPFSSPAPARPTSSRNNNANVAPESVSGDVIAPELLFTENETNFNRLYDGQNRSYAKDAFHDHIIPAHRPHVPEPVIDGSATAAEEAAQIDGNAVPVTPRTHAPALGAHPKPHEEGASFVNPEKKGTKAGAHYVFEDVPGRGGCAVVRLRLTKKDKVEDDEEGFDTVVDERKGDADEFYARFNSGALSDDLRNVMRQALAGMLWTKQFFMYIQKDWIEGDPGQPPPPPERKFVRNREWKHLYINDVLSMPDKWEYPFFCTWDTAFHCIPLAMVDPAYAKKQLDLMTREWYMKPDGALPAYEWNYGDVNPPVHAWATFRVFKIERKMYGREDLAFLERVFQKLLLNFTWWVNRKDKDGQNVFEGGFLGLDNIGLFNRSEALPTGGTLRQADGTAWMAFYSLNMLNMALELAKHNKVYEDIASKFFEHFIFISDAMTFRDLEEENEASLWNDEDGFYYDAITWGAGNSHQLPVRSLVGLIPLYATLTLEPGVIKQFPGFKKRMDWFIENRSEMAQRNIANMKSSGKGDRRLLALASEDRLKRILTRMLDESEFLSEHGIRSMSRQHKEHPYSMTVNGEEFSVNYWPGDSHSAMFGGNSNWRGPIWLATNSLLIESLQRFHQYYGSKFELECPTGSGDNMDLASIANEIQHRIIHIFARDRDGKRAYNGGNERLDRDPHFRDYLQFHEFFHADNGKGLGASHQTGWTGLVAWFIFQAGANARLPRTPRTPRSTAAHYFDDIIPTTPAASDTEVDYQSAGEMTTDEL